MDYKDTRRERRVDGVRATVEFEYQKYNVINISASALLIESESGFAPETVEKFRSSACEFKLLDLASNSEMLCRGKFVRCEESESGGKVPDRQGGGEVPERQGRGKVTRIALSFEPKEKKSTRPLRSIAVGGGKGGVGKTLFSVNLAVTLSQVADKEVILFDGDFGNANCHTLLGITRLEKTVEDYLRQGLRLQEIVVPTAYKKMGLICGASDKIDNILRESSKKERLLQDLRQLTSDYVIVDLGAGVGDDALDIYNAADDRIIVVTPELTALQNAYSFVKAALFHDLRSRRVLGPVFDEIGNDLKILSTLVGRLSADDERRLEFRSVISRQRVGIVGNMIESEKDHAILRRLQEIIKEYLDVDSMILGTLGPSAEVRHSVNRITPFVTTNAYSVNSQVVRQIAIKIETDRKVSAVG